MKIMKWAEAEINIIICFHTYITILGVQNEL